jgi:hypothetical protein
MELIEQLTNSLGIDEAQAKGGAGLIFRLVKDQLGKSEFSQVADQVPGIDGLIDAAPEGGLGSALSGIASGFGGGAGKLAGLGSLAGGFSKLGLDSDMIARFAPIVLSFIQSKGGDEVKALVQKVLT